MGGSTRKRKEKKMETTFVSTRKQLDEALGLLERGAVNDTFRGAVTDVLRLIQQELEDIKQSIGEPTL